MDKPDLTSQLSNLLTQISGASKTQPLPQPATSELPTQPLQRALQTLLAQPQNGQILARLEASTLPSDPIIATQPKGEHLVAVLVRGQRFLLSTALDLKPGMEIRLNVQNDQITLKPGSITAPTAQLNAEIQQAVSKAHPTAPPPLNIDKITPQTGTTQLPQGIDARLIQQLSTLLQQLPSAADLSQSAPLKQWVNDNLPPLAQQLSKLPQQPTNTLPPLTANSTPPTSMLAGQAVPAQALPPEALTQLASLLGERNLPLVLAALTQVLPKTSTEQPAPQPLAVQLPNISYPFPQRTSPTEKSSNIGDQLKRLAHWFKANQDQQQLHQLLQLQSSQAGDENTRPAPQFWLEVPLRVDQQIHWLQIQLRHEDAKDNNNSEENPDEKEQVWQLQLRLERPETGAIYASVYFKKPKLDVQFWAEQPATLGALQAAIPAFNQTLKNEGIEECSVMANPGAMTANATTLDQRRLHVEA